MPAFTPAQEKIPFGRVNHNKYMVTDNAAYIGKIADSLLIVSSSSSMLYSTAFILNRILRRGMGC